MRRALVALAAILLAIPSAVAAEETFVDKYYAWEYACTLQEYSCEGIKPPKIKLINRGSSFGSFHGGTAVYINPRYVMLGSELYRTVLVHEMVHYLDFKRGQLVFGPFNAESVCRSEERAFRVSDAYADMLGLWAFKRGPDWWKSYWHCEPYYNPDWDVWEWLQRRFG